MSEQHLYVSLGHNASAVFAREGNVVRGYEQERIDRVKSSSAYPKEAIELALGDAYADEIFVSHWFDKTELETNKYLDLEHLCRQGHRISSVSLDFTHHDAHAGSAVSFFRSNGGKCANAVVVVMDGFGTSQEILSIYDAKWPLRERPKLVHRSYGYSYSLGLMYQYMTKYIGLKPNQDEYKLLGYESHVLNYIPLSFADSVKGLISDQAIEHALRTLGELHRPSPMGRLIDYDDLAHAERVWTERFAKWEAWFHAVDSKEGTRACLAFCAQTFIEVATVRMLENVLRMRPDLDQLILAGGCFYNVKLNRRVHLRAGRKTFAHPLAGDQGAPLGFTPTVRAHGLAYGEREIGRRDQWPINVLVTDESKWVSVASEYLSRNRIVNVVRGDMEYGPRALCNTTTFALPNRENVMLINMLNERDEQMPMAPVMSRHAARSYFDYDELHLIDIADRFMITTVGFMYPPPKHLVGVAHKDPTKDVWTARPQIVDYPSPVLSLLKSVEDETLINTSFNYHGEPIVMTEDDACKTHEMQCLRAKLYDILPPVTILVRS